MAEDKEGVIIKLLREATPFEIGIVAFLFLPPILLAWIPILGAILPSGYEHVKPWAFLAVAIIYIVLVAIMVRGKVKAEREKREELRRQQEELIKLEEEKRKKKENTRELIRKALHHPEFVWRTPHWVAIESGLSEEEAKEYLREMAAEGEVAWGTSNEHPEWGHIVKLTSRAG